MFSLQGQKALVVGVANDQSIAWGCARALRAHGADLAVTWLNDKPEPHVRPLAEHLGAEIMAPLGVRQPGQMQAMFVRIADRWGRLDTLLHSIAFAPKDDLHGRVLDCSADGFALAMDVSVHSFLRMIRLAPQINEAINCVYEWLATAEDIDSMMKLGANHPMGPLSLGDLIGLDVVLNIMERLYRGFDDPSYRPSPLLKQMVAAGYLGRKTGRGFAVYPPH